MASLQSGSNKADNDVVNDENHDNVDEPATERKLNRWWDNEDELEFEKGKLKLHNKDDKHFPRLTWSYHVWTNAFKEILSNDNQELFEGCVAILHKPQEWKEEDYLFMDRFLLQTQDRIEEILILIDTNNYAVNVESSAEDLYKDRQWARRVRKIAQFITRKDGWEHALRVAAYQCRNWALPQQEEISKLAVTFEEEKEKQLKNNHNCKQAKAVLDARKEFNERIQNYCCPANLVQIKIIPLQDFNVKKINRKYIGRYEFAPECLLVRFNITLMNRDYSPYTFEEVMDPKNASTKILDQLWPDHLWNVYELGRHIDDEKEKKQQENDFNPGFEIITGMYDTAAAMVC